MDYEITHDKEKKKFYTEIEGKEAVLEYTKEEEGVLNYRHTFVPREMRGKNIASELVSKGMEYARKEGYKVLPSCPFVKAFIIRNKRYKDITVTD